MTSDTAAVVVAAVFITAGVTCIAFLRIWQRRPRRAPAPARRAGLNAHQPEISGEWQAVMNAVGDYGTTLTPPDEALLDMIGACLASYPAARVARGRRLADVLRAKSGEDDAWLARRVLDHAHFHRAAAVALGEPPFGGDAIELAVAAYELTELQRMETAQ